jgi:hypothetical protein
MPAGPGIRSSGLGHPHPDGALPLDIGRGLWTEAGGTLQGLVVLVLVPPRLKAGLAIEPRFLNTNWK